MDDLTNDELGKELEKDKEQLSQYTEAEPEQKKKTKKRKKPSRMRTDLGNAERFVDDWRERNRKQLTKHK